MRQFHHDNKSQISKELITLPGPLVSRILISNSKSNNFNDAKVEWDLVGHIQNDSAEFVENCELCNHKNYLGNWQIYNSKTQKSLRVGSECIKRFIILNGISNQEDSNTFFEQKERELREEYKLKELYNAVIVEKIPLARNLKKFREVLLNLLNSRGQNHIKTKEEIYTFANDLFNKSLIPEEELERLYNIINEPNLIVTQRENKSYRCYIREGQTWIKKNKVTFITLSNSEAYRPDENYRYKK